VGLMLTTVNGFVDKYGTNAATGGELIVGAVAISAVLGLAAYVALQLPEIAGALAGGGASLAAHVVSRTVTTPALAAGASAAAGAWAGTRSWTNAGWQRVRTSHQGGSLRRG